MAQPFKKSAIDVLSDEDEFLTAAEIVERAVQKGLLDRDKMTQAPEGMMSAVLSNNIRQRGSASEFVKLDGRFGLKRAGGRATSSVPGQILFNGKAGEHSVVSELLFYGFDACPASVDEETDIFAVKDGRCFFLQVKTSVPAGNRCSFFIPPDTHKKFDYPDAYYAFVVRSGTCNNFLVMPYREIQKHIESGSIGKSGGKYIAKFAWGDKITLDGLDVTGYRRRWPEA